MLAGNAQPAAPVEPVPGNFAPVEEEMEETGPAEAETDVAKLTTMPLGPEKPLFIIPSSGVGMLLIQGADAKQIEVDGTTLIGTFSLPNAYSHVAIRERDDLLFGIVNGKNVLELVEAGAKQARRSLKLEQMNKKITEVLDLAVHPSEPYAYVTVKSTNEDGDPRDYMLMVNTQSGEIEGEPSVCSRVAIDRAGANLYCCSGTMLTANSIDSGVRKYKGLVQFSYGERTGLRLSPEGRRIVCLQHDEIPTGLGDVSAYNAKMLSDPPMVYETGLQQRPEDLAFHPTLEVVAIGAPVRRSIRAGNRPPHRRCAAAAGRGLEGLAN